MIMILAGRYRQVLALQGKAKPERSAVHDQAAQHLCWLLDHKYGQQTKDGQQGAHNHRGPKAIRAVQQEGHPPPIAPSVTTTSITIQRIFSIERRRLSYSPWARELQIVKRHTSYILKTRAFVPDTCTEG